MSDGICTLPGSCGVPCEAGSAGGATELAETTEGRTVQFPCNGRTLIQPRSSKRSRS